MEDEEGRYRDKIKSTRRTRVDRKVSIKHNMSTRFDSSASPFQSPSLSPTKRQSKVLEGIKLISNGEEEKEEDKPLDIEQLLRQEYDKLKDIKMRQERGEEVDSRQSSLLEHSMQAVDQPENVGEGGDRHGLQAHQASKSLYRTRFIDELESMIPRHREQEVLAMSGSLL